MLLPDTDEAAALQLAGRILKLVAQLQPDYEGRTIAVTTSIGCVTLESPAMDAVTALAHLQKQADAALYLAKQRGRNRVETAVKSDK